MDNVKKIIAILWFIFNISNIILSKSYANEKFISFYKYIKKVNLDNFVNVFELNKILLYYYKN